MDPSDTAFECFQASVCVNVDSDVLVVRASSKSKPLLHKNAVTVEFWAYDYNANAWTELKPDKPIPYLLYRHAMVYNANADRIIAFGGETLLGDELGSQTWAYDPQANTWTDMTLVQ